MLVMLGVALEGMSYFLVCLAFKKRPVTYSLIDSDLVFDTLKHTHTNSTFNMG